MHEIQNVPAVRFYQDDWWMREQNNRWIKVTDSFIDAAIGIIQDKDLTYTDEDGETKYSKLNLTGHKANEITRWLKRLAFVDERREMPMWLDDAEYSTDLPDPNDLLVFQNGIFHWKTEVFGGHDQRLFTSTVLPFDYDEDALCPDWVDFLDSLFPNDRQSIDALQEMFGYVITGQTDLQKVFLIVGPPRAGKSTIGSILTQMVGEENVAGLSLGDLGGNFSLETLIGKRLNICSDARVRGDTYKIVEKLVAISGGDRQSVDIKFKSRRNIKLGTNFVIISNEAPSLDDPSGAMASRFIPIDIKVPGWLGREDTTLQDRLLTELPGIFNWAMVGLRRLVSQGKFTYPESSHMIKAQLEESSSPIKTFVATYCVVEDGVFVPKIDMYSLWKKWCEEQGTHPGANVTFHKKLKTQVPNIGDYRPRIDGKQVSCHSGIGLNEEGRARVSNPFF